MNERCVNEFLLNTITGMSGDFCQNLRAVQVDIKDEILNTWFYFDGKITDENRELANVITDRASSCLSKKYESKEKYLERVDYPFKIPNKGRFAYLRYEASYTQITYHFLEQPPKKLLSAFNKDEDSTISETCNPAFISLLLHEAFLGSIKPNLRAVAGELNELDKVVYIWIYFDGEISNDDLLVMNLAIDKIKTYFHNHLTVKASIDRIDKPQALPDKGTFIFNSNDCEKSDYHYLEDSKKNITSETYDISYYMRNMQEALLRNVGVSLRSVKIETNDLKKTLYLWFFYDGEVSANEYLNIFDILNYIKDRKGSEFSIDTDVVRLDYPNKMPSLGVPVYERDEQYEEKDQKQNLTVGLHYFGPRDLLCFKRNIQYALLGKIGPSLRSVKIEIDELKKILWFWFYYDGEISQRNRLNAESVISYVKDTFKKEFFFNEEIIRLDYPNKIPSSGVPVYERDESIAEEKYEQNQLKKQNIRKKWLIFFIVCIVFIVGGFICITN